MFSKFNLNMLEDVNPVSVKRLSSRVRLLIIIDFTCFTPVRHALKGVIIEAIFGF